MTLAREETRWDGAYPNLAQEVIVSDEYHPELHGSNIYGLIRVLTDDGKQHLVGTVSKAARIVDFTTGQTVYDFSTFGAKPRAGGDSYGAVAFWRGRYYFGGWVITPSPIGGGLNTADKYTYLISTTDLVNWTVHLKDKADSASTWKAEISDLIPTNDHLYILRGDGDSGGGAYRFDGTTFTLVDGLPAIKGALHQDNVWWATRGSSSLKRRSAVDGADPGDVNLTSGPSVSGGAFGWDSIYQGTSLTLMGRVHAFGKSGFWNIGQDGSSPTFVPVLPALVGNATRCLGWRSQAVYAAGGVVVPANVTDPDIFGYTAAAQSMLLWIGPNGQVRVIETGGLFSGLATFADRLYYGVSANPHGNSFSNHQAGGVHLGSIPLSDIKRTSIAYSERIYTPPSAGNLWGGFPTLGYTSGKLILKSWNADNLNIWHYTSEQPAVKVGTIAFAANERKIIDLAPYFAGGLMGFNMDGGSGVEGSIAYW